MNENQLIGAEVSLYTGKLRSYLQYKGIPFNEVPATVELYRSVIIPRTGVQYIPVLITEDDIALQDTTTIIDFMEQRFPQISIYPRSPRQRLVALLMEIYGDEWLVLPAMYYRWAKTENREFAYQEFGRTSLPEASKSAQYAIGKKSAEPFAGALPRLGITEHNAGAIEASYTAFLREFNQHLRRSPYLLGVRPSLGDFGLVGPLYAHLYRDPYSGKMMEEVAPYVAAWVRRMTDPSVKEGYFFPNDQVPDTLTPILTRMFAEQGPVLRTTIDYVSNWVDKNGEDKVEMPRVIGEHRFSIGGVEENRLVFPYCQWMWQRAYDFYHGLDNAAKKSVDEMLQSIPGALETFNYPIKQRLSRRNNRLILEPNWAEVVF